MRARWLFLLAWVALAAPAAGGWELGAGMEYYSLLTYARDAEGRSFQTLLQTTLATAAAGWRLGPWSVEVQGAWSDWNDFGEWRGTETEPTAFEDLWARQQRWQARMAWEVWPEWQIGTGVSDHQVRHYVPPLGNLTLLHVRQQSAFLYLAYAPLITPDFRLELLAAYAPFARVELYQSTETFGQVPARVFEAAGPGRQAGGGLHARYQDSAGWGVDMYYHVDMAWFDRPGDLAEIWLRSGRLTGVLRLDF